MGGVAADPTALPQSGAHADRAIVLTLNPAASIRPTQTCRQLVLHEATRPRSLRADAGTARPSDLWPSGTSLPAARRGAGRSGASPSSGAAT